MSAALLGAGFVVLGGLGGLGGLGAMLAGFRACCGRTGLVPHRHLDVAAFGRGLALGAALTLPVAVLTVTDASSRPGREAVHRRVRRAMLAWYAPYGALVLLALAAYRTLHWRRRFLATALLLCPLRPPRGS